MADRRLSRRRPWSRDGVGLTITALAAMELAKETSAQPTPDRV